MRLIPPITATLGFLSLAALKNGRVAPHLLRKQSNLMKKTNQILKTRNKMSLGDLILAVSSCSKNTKETVAAVADLLGSGQVRLESNGRFTRAQVC